MRTVRKDAKIGNNKLGYKALALTVAFVLMFSAVSTATTIGFQTAFAEKGGEQGTMSNSGDQGKTSESKVNKSNQTASSTSSANSNVTESEDNNVSNSGKNKNDKGKGTQKSGKSSSTNSPSWTQYANQTGEEIHAKHLKMKASALAAYPAGLTYTLNANGTAKAIGNSNYTGDADLSLEMSVWKSRPSLVSMDVTGGSLTVDGETMEIQSGHAHYMNNSKRLLLIAFMTDNDGSYSESNDDEDQQQQEEEQTNVNQTSSTNTTNTSNTTTTNQTSGDNNTAVVEEEDQEVDEEEEEATKPKLRLLKLWITMTGEAAKLPNNESSSSTMEVEVMSRQSKVASMWFLEMAGEVALSTTT